MYTVSFEIAGPMAMFTRPDSGSTPVSYPPTWSAMSECSRLWRGWNTYRPTHVEICRPVRFGAM